MPSAIVSAWGELYAAQSEFVGVITATIDGVAESKKCIPTEAPWIRDNADGGGGKEWSEERTLQMLVSDFSGTPTQFADVSISDDDRPARLLDWHVNNGIYYLRVEYIGDEAEDDSEPIVIGDEDTGEAIGDEDENILVGDPDE